MEEVKEAPMTATTASTDIPANAPIASENILEKALEKSTPTESNKDFKDQDQSTTATSPNAAPSKDSNENDPIAVVTAQPEVVPSKGPGGPPPRVGRRVKRIAAKSHLNTASPLRPSTSLAELAAAQRKRSLSKSSSGGTAAKKKRSDGKPAKAPKEKVRKTVSKAANGEKKTSGLGSSMTYEGPPTRKLGSREWPKGWIERTFARQTTTSARADSYFYPPGRNDHKLRSIKEVERYLDVWEKTKDAEKAWKARKGG